MIYIYRLAARDSHGIDSPQPAIDSWLVGRMVFHVARMAVPPSFPDSLVRPPTKLYDEVNRMCEYYDKMTELAFPQEWLDDPVCTHYVVITPSFAD